MMVPELAIGDELWRPAMSEGGGSSRVDDGDGAPMSGGSNEGEAEDGWMTVDMMGQMATVGAVTGGRIWWLEVEQRRRRRVCVKTKYGECVGGFWKRSTGGGVVLLMVRDGGGERGRNHMARH
ncbi:hypothetical protein GUJ93_ZPchr0006g45887 [Zizania palustris]|uniref:Uncharacterized protein n=1 Tax=Zizania palustris TaxID=103762 RepID=A0A8J5SN35_ZIZPA|nr:hypothetical protein GUJ93_ZPchr0006g45887 [Zizania palustris]